MTKKIKKNGFTLVELLLVIGITTLGAISLYNLYGVTSTTNNANEEMKRLSTYVKAVEGATVTNGDFTHININNFEDLGIVIDTKFGLTNISSSTPRSLDFIYNGIQTDVCSKFITKVLGANLNLNATLNNIPINTANYVIEDIASECAATPSNTIIFTAHAGNNNLTLTDETLVPGYNYNPGNPGSVAVGNWGDPVIGPVVEGKTSTNIAGGGGGFGYTGGLGNIGNSIGGGYNNPPTFTGTNNPAPPVPWDTNWIAPSITGVAITGASIKFKAVESGSNALITMNNLSVTGAGFPNNQDFKIEYAAQSFNILQTSPVVVTSSNTAVMDEISGNVTARTDGTVSYAVTTPENVTEYFVNPGDNFIYKNSPMMRFLASTFKTIPINVDIISRRSNQLVATTQIFPDFQDLIVYDKDVVAYGGNNSTSDEMLVRFGPPGYLITSGTYTQRLVVNAHIDPYDDVWGERLRINTPGFFGWDGSNPMMCSNILYDKDYNVLTESLFGGTFKFKLEDFQKLDQVVVYCRARATGS